MLQDPLSSALRFNIPVDHPSSENNVYIVEIVEYCSSALKDNADNGHKDKLQPSWMVAGLSGVVRKDDVRSVSVK